MVPSSQKGALPDAGALAEAMGASGQGPKEARRGEQAHADGALVLMTLNLQYFASFPKDEAAATARLREVTGGPNPPDLICVQEGLASRDVLEPVGFELQVCSGKLGLAQSVREMVYGDAPTLRNCDAAVHSELLCNQIYLRRGSPWTLLDQGAMQISSDLTLQGGGGRAEGKLALRSMVWVKIRKCDEPRVPAVYVMCTHLTGGRFEDQFFLQQLSRERYQQPDRIISLFNNRRDPKPDDVGILLGDFNATSEYVKNGPMSSYFTHMIATSEGVQADAQLSGMELTLEKHFADYMISPFEAIQEEHGWVFAYTQDEVGATSGFGHLIDHMATSRPLKVPSAEVIYLTNQKMGDQPNDTDLPLSDHNSVKAVFSVC